jgi:signal transduction histidine kinase
MTPAPSWRSRWTAQMRRLTVRVALLSTALVAVALLIVAVIITDLYRSAIERRFDALLSAHLFALAAGTDVTAGNVLVGAPRIGDARYAQPESGWFWEVIPASPATSGRLSSPFFKTPVAAPAVATLPFDANFERRYGATGPAGEHLRVAETEVVLGQDDVVGRFRVIGNLNEVDDEVLTFRRRVALYLGLAGLLMVAVNAVAIILALRPLGAARTALESVRAGRAENLAGHYPTEIQPLANEINALIDNNHRIVDRARVQVGDLAHALKTPLAVIVNEAGAAKNEHGRIIADQAAIMRRQIDHYLQRARFAAQRGTVAYRTDALPLIERMVRVFQKLSPAMAFQYASNAQPVVFAGEAQDLEEIAGNLLENAAKWANGRVVIRIGQPESGNAPDMLRLVIEDDGPGIPEAQRKAALERGRRLDETKPGTGLGLSIVAELAREYGGALTLDESPLGGLRATVALPAAPA